MENLRLRGSGARQSSPKRTVLVGNEVLTSPPIPKDAIINFISEEGNHFGLSESQLSRGLMLVGGTGSGKTTTINEMLDQLIPKLTQDDVMIIFDSKQDFMSRYFNQSNKNHILITSDKQYKDCAYSWNIFAELLDENGGFDEAETISLELAKSLFKEVKSESQPFFSIASADIFAKLLYTMAINCDKNNDFSKFNNKAIVEFINNSTIADYYKLLGNTSNSRYIQNYLGNADKPNNQALGILGYLNAMVNSLFVGLFKEDSSYPFSFRRAIRKKEAKVIFLEYDIKYGESLAPIYSLIMDLAIKEALGIGKGNTYLVLDELNMIPYCSRLQDCLNLGRGRGLKTIVGLQTINQLFNHYSEAQAKSILAGFGNLFAYKSNYETRQFICERLGKTFESINFGGINITKEGFTVSDSDIINLGIGQAYIDTIGNKPFKFNFKEV